MIPKIPGLKTAEVRALITSCKSFLQMDISLPLEIAHSSDDMFRKLKLRHKNRLAADVDFNDIFNKAVGRANLRERSLIITPITQQEIYSNYYVFPVDGFQFLYNPSVKDSAALKQDLIEPLAELMETDTTEEVLREMISEYYISKSLQDAILSDCEIMIYNIPWCFIIHKDIGDFFEIRDILRTSYA